MSMNVVINENKPITLLILLSISNVTGLFII